MGSKTRSCSIITSLVGLINIIGIVYCYHKSDRINEALITRSSQYSHAQLVPFMKPTIYNMHIGKFPVLQFHLFQAL